MTSSITDSVVISSAYPARYYAAYDTSVTGITRVTALYDVQSPQITVQTLPEASTLIPMTAEQWDLVRGARNIWVQDGTLMYPARYYASYDDSTTHPTPVTGWYDTWLMSDISSVPVASRMVPISSSDWNDTNGFRLPVGRGVQGGKIIDHIPPAPSIPLEILAKSDLATARTHVYNNYGILNEPTPDEWVVYLKALMAIANGKDTTSTELPTPPQTL